MSPVMVEIYESDIEYKVTEYAGQLGCLVLKLNVIGRVGWPDRVFIYHKRLLFIEFKRPGEKARKIQGYIHECIRKHGFPVKVVDSVAYGCGVIDSLTKGGELL